MRLCAAVSASLGGGARRPQILQHLFKVLTVKQVVTRPILHWLQQVVTRPILQWLPAVCRSELTSPVLALSTCRKRRVGVPGVSREACWPCCAWFSVMSDSTTLWTVWSPPGSSVLGDSPGKNTGVGTLSLLQGIFLTQGSNPGLLHCRQILYCLSHQGSLR